MQARVVPVVDKVAMLTILQVVSMQVVGSSSRGDGRCCRSGHCRLCANDVRGCVRCHDYDCSSCGCLHLQLKIILVA